MGIRHGGRFIPMGAKKTYIEKIRGLFGTSLIAYYPLNETSGTTALDASGNGRNGTYTGVDLANTAAPGGGRAPYFDGANDYVDVYSASLATAFSGSAGSAMIWAKVYDAGVWTDSAYRELFRFYVDANNYVLIEKQNTNGVLNIAYKAGGTTETLGYSSLSDTGWVCWGVTWSAAADQVIGYKNGVAGTPATTLGTWAGSIVNTATLLGASTKVPARVWNGWLAQCMVLNRVATPTEMLTVYNLGS